MNIIIIGGTAAGTSAAAKIRRTYPETNITIYEKTAITSLGGCGMPYYIGDLLTNPHELIARTPKQFNDSGINVKINHEVTSINFDTKTIDVTDEEGSTFTDNYDKLIITVGSKPINPPFVDFKIPHIYNFKTLDDAIAIKNEVDSGSKKAVIIGAGFIGLELAENLHHKKIDVTIIERESSMLQSTFNSTFAKTAQEVIEDHKINIAFGEEVTTITDNLVITDKNQYEYDFVVVAIGFKPNTSFISDDRLNKLPNGAIIIDSYGRTSVPDVYSAGDCATVVNMITNENSYIPLATTANKIGKLLGSNIFENNPELFPGTLGSAGLKLFDFEMLRTGLTLDQALKHFPSAKEVIVNDRTHPSFIPSSREISASLVYDQDSKLLLGAQVVGTNTAQRLNPLSVAIANKMKTTDLIHLDLPYSPPFSRTTDIIHILGSIAK